MQRDRALQHSLSPAIHNTFEF